jgi:hypothetical protein
MVAVVSNLLRARTRATTTIPPHDAREVVAALPHRAKHPREHSHRDITDPRARSQGR